MFCLIELALSPSAQTPIAALLYAASCTQSNASLANIGCQLFLENVFYHCFNCCFLFIIILNAALIIASIILLIILFTCFCIFFRIFFIRWTHYNTLSTPPTSSLLCMGEAGRYDKLWPKYRVMGAMPFLLCNGEETITMWKPLLTHCLL